MTIINFNRKPENIKTMLSEINEIGYEELMVIGIKDETINTHSSYDADITRLIGLLEMLKQDLLKQSELE